MLIIYTIVALILLSGIMLSVLEENLRVNLGLFTIAFIMWIIVVGFYVNNETHTIKEYDPVLKLYTTRTMNGFYITTDFKSSPTP